MRVFRFRRWRVWLAGAAVAVGAAAAIAGWTWAVVTPEIGQPFVLSAAPGGAQEGAASRPAVRGQKLWSFGFVGDTHAGLADGTVDRIFAQLERANLEFVLHLGDMVDVGAADSQWDQLARLAWAHRIRLLPVVGNHDPHRGYPRDRGEIRFRQYFPCLPETFYSFHHRGLCFVMLNSERSLLPGSQQATFLSRQLARQPFSTIVCLHRPVFTCGTRDQLFLLGRRFCLHRVLRDTSTVCVLTGHNHYYERTRPLDGITYLVSGGGTANQYGAEQPDARTARFVAGRSHYGLVEVREDHLAVRIVDLEGSILDEFAVPVKLAAASGHQPWRAWSRQLPPIAALEHFRPSAPGDQRAAVTDSVRPAGDESVASRALPRPW